MSKKELLDKKLDIFKKMLENKDKPVETMIEEQEKNKEILNPNFENRSPNSNGKTK